VACYRRRAEDLRATADFVVKGGQQSVKPRLANEDLGPKTQGCHARGNSYPLTLIY